MKRKMRLKRTSNFSLMIFVFLFSTTLSFGQNQNISQGNIFDGEPFLAINPNNSQHFVIAWMGFNPFTKVLIKTKVSLNAGKTWSSVKNIPHTNIAYGSADPSLGFDNNGNVFLTYVDFSKSIDSGSVYLRKSTDGGLTWGAPVEVINAYSDLGKYPIDRPWMSIDLSNGANAGNIYVTTMPPTTFGFVAPPYRPYFAVSTNGGSSFKPWQYLDSTGWLAGNFIKQPMPTNCVSTDGIFYGIYPSYLPSQNIFAQFILASTSDAGNHFSYQSVFTSTNGVKDPLAKKGYLIRANPANASHLAFFYLDVTHGDLDVFIRESFNKGLTWTTSKRINNDPIGNNKMQDLLWADFDADGDLVVAWRDRRNGMDSTYKTASEIWGAVRLKDSSNFSPNFVISDNLTPYDTILALSGNDFLCIKLNRDTLNATWGDTRNGKLNIWFQRMTLDGKVLSIRNLSSENIPAIKIYPNPASSMLTVMGKDIIKIVIVNSEGKILFTEQFQNYVNEVEIEINHFSTSVYFAHITTAHGHVTKKLVKK